MNKNYITKSPVLLILFNRPEYFNQLINALRDVSVSELFISIDAPRENNMVEDSKKISELLEMIKIWDVAMVQNQLFHGFSIMLIGG